MHTNAIHKGKLVVVVNISWSERFFKDCQKAYPNADVAVEDREGNKYLVPLRELEWRAK